MIDNIGTFWQLDKDTSHFVRYRKKPGHETEVLHTVEAEPTRDTHHCGGRVWAVGAFRLCEKCAAEVRP